MDEFVRCPQCDDDLPGEDWEQHLGTHGYFKRPIDTADAPEGPYKTVCVVGEDPSIKLIHDTSHGPWPAEWLVHHQVYDERYPRDRPSRFRGTQNECNAVRDAVNRLDAQQKK